MKSVRARKSPRNSTTPPNKPKLIVIHQRRKPNVTGLAKCLRRFGPELHRALNSRSKSDFETDVKLVVAATRPTDDHLKALYEYAVMTLASYESAKKAGAL